MAASAPAAAAVEPAARGPAAARLMRLATYASVSTASFLILAKFVAYVMTDAVSLLSTLLDSVLDVLASLVNLMAVRQALVPADREHRFGHGKAEALAGLAQAAFIAGSAAFLMFEVGRRLLSPQPVSNTGVGVGVMVLSILLTLLLVAYQRHVVRRTGSIAIRADALHYVGDFLVNLSVIAALLLTGPLGWRLADPIFGAGIAVYIVYSAWLITKGSLDMLMDRELPEADRRRIRQIGLAHPSVRALHDLRTRTAGRHAFIQFHLEMDGSITLAEAHVVSDAVEAAVMEAFPDAEVIIHQDPAGVPERRATFA